MNEDQPQPTLLVHCFRCDDVVTAAVGDDGALWCPTCNDEVLGSPDEGAASRLVVRDGRIVNADAEDRPDYGWTSRPRRGGGMIGNALIGLHNALYGPKEDPPAVVVDDDEKLRDGPVELHLDEEHPSQSWARFRHRPPKEP